MGVLLCKLAGFPKEKSSEEEMIMDIEATVASFKNLPLQNPIKNAVVYFWESHTKNPDDRSKIQSTVDLIPKRFDLATCEKYEVRTGYLSRYNYLSRIYHKSSLEDLEKAIIKGEDEQTEWIERCKPDLPDFTKKNWQQCVGNPHFSSCRKLLEERIQNDALFAKAYEESADNYSVKRKTNRENGLLYLIEENAWILTIPLLHPNKPVYIIHVGNVTDSTNILFSTFEYLRDSTRLLFPYFEHRTFASTADFLIEYKNKTNVGYYIDNEEAVGQLIQAKQSLTKDDWSKLLMNERAEKELLYNIIGKLPGHVYWLSKKNVYLGCNDLQARHLGLSSRDEIVGKAVSDLLSAEEAKKHTSINKQVLERGKSYFGEERASMYNGFRTYLSQKSPLVDSFGKVVGLLGVSVDISDRKNAESLRLRNKMQKVRIEEQKEFREFSAQVLHDITSPLLTLECLVKSTDSLDNHSTLLKNVTSCIRSIFEALRKKCMEDRRKAIESQPELILISLLLRDALENKKYEYQKTLIKFNYSFSPAARYAFIKGDRSNFERMFSNLINNAVEACGGSQGTVDVFLDVGDNWAKVTVKDSGSGLPNKIFEKILARSNVFGSTKHEGAGLGLGQILATVDSYGGTLDVESSGNDGTTFLLKFPLVDCSEEVAKELIFTSDDVIVVLDNNPEVFRILEKRLGSFTPRPTLKFFSKSSDASDFVESFLEKEKIFLLSEQEPGDGTMDRLMLILQSRLPRSRCLVLSDAQADGNLQDLVRAANVKILFKPFLQDVPIMVIGE
ncbi:MAG: PAS domain-containing protein [Holosporaceae bacterium]|jgi:PAS domain S-box-containing protein|nr:PAS domain-containing protein [Holosporaceae bacterium]